MSSPAPTAIPDRWLRLLTLLVIVALGVFILDRAAAVVVPVVRKILGILNPALVALALAYLLDPVVDRIEEKGRSRNFGIALVVLALVVALTLGLLFVVPTVTEQVSELGPRIAQYTDRAMERVRTSETLRQALGSDVQGSVSGALALLKEHLQDIDLAQVVPPVTRWLTSVASSGYEALLAIVNLFLIPILTVYLLKDIDVLRERAISLIPASRRDWILAPLREIDAALSRFVRGQLMVATCLAFLYAVGLWLSGTPLGLTIGLLAGAVAFIPYLGLVIGLVPALLLNFLEHGDVPHLLGVVATFAIAQILEGTVITPKIVGDSVGLHPVLVILAVVAGGSFFGLAGMLLAIPALAAAMVFVRRAEKSYRESAWYAGDGHGEPEAG